MLVNVRQCYQQKHGGVMVLLWLEPGFVTLLIPNNEFFTISKEILKE